MNFHPGLFRVSPARCAFCMACAVQRKNQKKKTENCATEGFCGNRPGTFGRLWEPILQLGSLSPSPPNMVAEDDHSGSPAQAQGETRRRRASESSRSRVHYRSEEYAVKFRFVNQILQAFQVDPQSTIDGSASDSNHRFSNYYTIYRQGPW